MAVLRRIASVGLAHVVVTLEEYVMYQVTIDTPAGAFTMVVDDEAVLASGWTFDIDDLVPLLSPALRSRQFPLRAEIAPFTRAVRDYFDGDLESVTRMPVKQRSGAFLEHAWAVLRAVPAGAPLTYREYAARCGRPAAVRAAGNACARNAAALFVPCHRVLRTGGALGGFRWGLPVKRWLLDYEAAAAG